MFKQWVKGWNLGLTGPNTPALPTVSMSLAAHRSHDSEGKIPYPSTKNYYIPIACGDDTVAIAVGPDREATADLIAKAPQLEQELAIAKNRITALERTLESIAYAMKERVEEVL